MKFRDTRTNSETPVQQCEDEPLLVAGRQKTLKVSKNSTKSGFAVNIGDKFTLFTRYQDVQKR